MSCNAVTQPAVLAAPAAMCLALWLDRRFGEPPAWIHPVVLLGRLLHWIGARIVTYRPWIAFFAGAVAWSTLFALLAWRMLCDEVRDVEVALARSLQAGRAQVARIAGRQTAALSAVEVRETAIEALAENLNDSVIAPLFWYALAGVPGAALYRFANTADAMWGKRGDWEWAGKWAARADDVPSFAMTVAW